jgi:hypothetical protein
MNVVLRKGIPFHSDIFFHDMGFLKLVKNLPLRVSSQIYPLYPVAMNVLEMGV